MRNDELVAEQHIHHPAFIIPEATMDSVRLGRTGLKVTPICLGTMTFGAQADEATGHAIMDRALERGVTFFDTADVYPQGVEQVGRTEEIIGTWLLAHRNEIVLAT